MSEHASPEHRRSVWTQRPWGAGALRTRCDACCVPEKLRRECFCVQSYMVSHSSWSHRAPSFRQNWLRLGSRLGRG